MNEKIILPIAIVLASFVIGGFYYAVQINKQESIEKQQSIELKNEEVELNKREAKQTELDQQYATCIKDADVNYWEYMRNNGTKNDDDGLIKTSTRVSDAAAKSKQQAVDNCFKQFK